jgi:hypothetical protein
MPVFGILIQLNLNYLDDDPDSGVGIIADPHSPGSYSIMYSIVYPHCFNADPDPAFFVNEDSDPAAGFRRPKIGKNLQLIILNFYQKLQFTYL